MNAFPIHACIKILTLYGAARNAALVSQNGQYVVVYVCVLVDNVMNNVAICLFPLLVESCFLASYSPSASCIPNLKLIASMAAEINRGSQNFLDAPLARTPANFDRKSCFSASYPRSPSCIPNLKLLASTVAEINRGPNFFWMLP